ncbi:MAG: hypothetical protein K9W45_00480 [Candidatus Heimdallarchaeum aukensis]|uniref:Uncharacterized protein n=1 Tax=Candidatus Heimdallarchaeum aukensis TaxID=2876573 RepID=A0A9Y1BL79_9ARCH|nr:MAG: hypothetical protein K9W45_00480 [Candidatus Heimdallarchaeum aukensis]
MTFDPRSTQEKLEDYVLFALLSIIFLILYIIGGTFVRFVLLLFIGVIVFSYVISKIVKIFTESKVGLSVSYWGNEILYTLFGIPLLVIAIFYLPVAVFLMFFGNTEFPVTDLIKWGTLVITVTLQISSLTVFLIRVRKDKKSKEEE